MKRMLTGLFAVAATIFTMSSSAMAQVAVGTGPQTKILEPQPKTALTHRNPASGTYFEWAQAQNGYGYCYEFTPYGQVLNGGQPVNNFMCEQLSPSFFNWGRGSNGYGYCYHFTGNGIPMDLGQPANNHYCERVSPSYYQWSTATNGYTYCFQFAGPGLPLNQGQPVANSFCQ